MNQLVLELRKKEDAGIVFRIYADGSGRVWDVKKESTSDFTFGRDMVGIKEAFQKCLSSLSNKVPEIRTAIVED